MHHKQAILCCLARIAPLVLASVLATSQSRGDLRWSYLGNRLGTITWHHWRVHSGDLDLIRFRNIHNIKVILHVPKEVLQIFWASSTFKCLGLGYFIFLWVSFPSAIGCVASYHFNKNTPSHNVMTSDIRPFTRSVTITSRSSPLLHCPQEHRCALG